MQSIALRRTVIAASRQAAARSSPSSPAARFISSTSLLRDQDKPDAASDSIKRGAQNTGKAASSAGKFVKEALKDVGDAAKGIFSEGRREGKEFRKEAGDAIKNRVSGANKK